MKPMKIEELSNGVHVTGNNFAFLTVFENRIKHQRKITDR